MWQSLHFGTVHPVELWNFQFIACSLRTLTTRFCSWLLEPLVDIVGLHF